MSLWKDVGTAPRRGPREWRDVLVASWELALTSPAFRNTPPDQPPLLPRAGGEGASLSARRDALVDRVAYEVPIMGLRVPWRSDRVVQALAARR